jgi:hypothetical protein
MTVVDIPENPVVDINRLVDGGGSRVFADDFDDLVFSHLVVVVFRVWDARPPWLIS